MFTLSDARTALESIHTLRSLTGTPTPEEAATLANWSGWGPLSPAFEPDVKGGWAEIANDLDELFLAHPDDLMAARDILDTSFYTPPQIISAVFDLLRATGFTGGRVLEPGCGSGRFMAGTPTDMDLSWTGVEMDPTSAAIAQALNPEATILASPMQKVTFTTGEFDVALGNVPFSSATVFDPAYPNTTSLHGYFLMRALDAVRVGGYVIAVTSRFTMDSINGLAEISQMADIAGAVRLPSGAFSDDGTEVATDIVLFRRRAVDIPLQGWNDKLHNTVEHSGSGYGYYGGRTVSNRLRITELIAEGRRADPVEVNNYWREHPEHVAGSMRITGNMHNPLSVITDDPTAEVSRAVAAASAQLLPILPRTGSLAPEVVFADVDLTDAEGRKTGSFHLVDGVVHVVSSGKLEPASRAGAELRVLIGLRDAAVALVEAEGDHASTDAMLDPLRATALAAYEAYVAKYGALNRGNLVEGKEDPETGQPAYSWRRPLMGGFRKDPDYVTVMALEKFNQETGEASPAPILLGRINHPPVPVTRADTPDEALAVALGEGRGIDLARIASLLGLDDKANAVEALGDRLYADPASGGAWTLDRDYLSGNVRQKLGDALEVAATNPAFDRNVAALQAVHPVDLGPLEIRVSLGAPWIKADDVRDFAKEVFGVNHPSVTHTPVVATWEVDTKGYFTAAASIAWGTEDKNPLELLDCALNGKTPTVMEEVWIDGALRKRRNAQATIAAEDKLRTVNERFSLWVWEDEARSDRICTEYNERFNSHVARRHDGSYLTFPTMSDSITLWDHQKDMIDRVISTPRVLCGHAVGSGKAQPMDAKILTPTGFRRMGDFMVGDEVVTPDGGTALVDGVFPQGELDLYRVTFSDGTSAECNDEHLWTYQHSREHYKKSNKWQTSTLREIMEKGIIGGKAHPQPKFFLPLVAAADFDCGLARTVDPYLLGMLLGDGSMSSGSLVFTTADKDLIDEVEKRIPKGLIVVKKKYGDYDYGITTGEKYGSRHKNKLSRALRDLHLMGSDSHSKFIPRAYLEAPAADRLAVLQGLMDTDGHVAKRVSRSNDERMVGSSIEYGSASADLIEGVQWLVRSLGGTVTGHRVQKVVNGVEHYRISFKLPPEFCPFRMERKKSIYVPAQKYIPRKSIVSAEKIGRKPMQCISVDHPDHLYVTDDFVVTHNTLSMIGSAISLRRFGLARKPLITVPKHLLEQIAREAQQAFPTSKFLIATEEDLKKENRRLFAARCATGDYDLIVMTHQAFTSLPVDPAIEERWIEEQKSELRGHLQGFGRYEGKSKGAKAVARAVRALESRLEALRYEVGKDDQVRFDQLGIDYIAVDECFPHETLIETDRGKLSIGQIVEQGLKVSVASTNLSTGLVEFKPIRRWVKKENHGPLIRIRHEGGEFTCTPNHPIWIEGRGYSRADSIAAGETVRTMRNGLYPEGQPGDVLLEGLQHQSGGSPEREASDLPGMRGCLYTSSTGSNILFKNLLSHEQIEETRGSWHAEENARCEHWSGGSRAHASGITGKNDREQPNEEGGKQREGLALDAGANLSTSEWWERKADCPSDAPGRTNGPADGIQYSNPVSEAFVRVSTEFLLGRSGRSGVETLDRDRREGPSVAQDKIAGSEEDGGLGSSRVVGVEVLERGGSERHGSGDSGDRSCFVYNLEVADNHNYFANGALVSNCHLFKRLATGASSSGGFSMGHSKRATDLLLKIETLAQRFPDKPIVGLFTGTPWSNTIAETFVWQKYLQPERLADAGVAMFDAWAANFVRFESRVEVSPDGATFSVKRRPSVIQNVPELMGMLGEVADILNADDIGLERPDATYENVGVDASDDQLTFVAELAARSERLRSGGKQILEDGRQDNMLLICTDGRKAALDPNLLGMEGDSPKINAAAERIAGVYLDTKETIYPGMSVPGSLQVAFCDYGTPHPGDSQSYGRLRAQLIELGVPADRIRWIHEAKTSKAREALFAQCRGGAVSVLIGSTETMGMGTNIQQRLVALHHVDAPWRPSDMTQRDGRALRPGNLNPAVSIFRYVTVGTFDGFMWQGLERKARFIAQMLSTGSTLREVEDVSDAELTFGEVKALAAGNPMLMEHTELQSEVKRLMTMRSVYQRSVNAARGRATQGRQSADSMRKLAEKIEEGVEIVGRQRPGVLNNLESLVGKILGSKSGSSYSYDGSWRGLSVSVERNRDEYYSTKLAMGPEATLIVKAGYHKVGSLVVRRSKLRNPEKAGQHLSKELQGWWDRQVDRVPTLRKRADELDVEAVAADQAADTAMFDGAEKLAAAVAKLEAREAAMAAEADTPAQELELVGAAA